MPFEILALRELFDSGWYKPSIYIKKELSIHSNQGVSNKTRYACNNRYFEAAEEWLLWIYRFNK
jgi:hypothetical protein